MKYPTTALLLGSLTLAACQTNSTLAPADLASSSTTTNTTSSTAVTGNAQNSLAALDLDDQRDFIDAKRGLIASIDGLSIDGPEGTPIWHMPEYDFIQGEAPATVNPSLWRQAMLNNIHGLFEVTPGIYQLRGFDLANMTLIEGDSGWIIVDPLTAGETAAKAMALAEKHLGSKPITAIIFTHSHVDHFGGVNGVMQFAAEQSTAPMVIAPEGFVHEATSENLIAGPVMRRRAMYMYGAQLERSATGHVGSGLGKGPAMGSNSILIPTVTIDSTPQKLVVDGVEFIFQHTPHSEAPAELTFYLPEFKAFCGAELISRTMHNLYTLRGAKVRDAVKWAAYIHEAIGMFPDTDILFNSHHWPLWGNADIIEFLEKQRDTYKYIHDQTVRMAAQGLTPREIAEAIQLPPSLASNFPTRGYYGTVKHNAKAVYQFYFGWFDGNPANLDPLTPVESAERYVQAIGGPGAVLTVANQAYNRGDYRWVAELLNHLVFAAPDNRDARELLAKAYEQLGYQAESGPWRDFYLTGAYELRNGRPAQGLSVNFAADLMSKTPISSFLDLVATLVNGPRAAEQALRLNFSFSDLDENYLLELKNGVLNYRLTESPAEADASLSLSQPLFLGVLLGKVDLVEALQAGQAKLDGEQQALVQFFSLLDQPNETFGIVEP